MNRNTSGLAPASPRLRPTCARRSARAILISCLLVLAALPAAAENLLAQSLRGSMSSVRRQYNVAQQHDYTLLRTRTQVQKFVDMGLLVQVPSSGPHHTLAGVSFPYARPEVKLFIERLSRQYYSANGEKLVVTSLTRPQNRQPRNASEMSVHPTGMAVDLRRPRSRRARQWLEDNLLVMERRGVIEATLERHPPHYHVAVFPRQYAEYVRMKTDRKAETTEDRAKSVVPAGDDVVAYTVQHGDSLWIIARSHQTTVDRIRSLNDMANNRIYPGQEILLPAR